MPNRGTYAEAMANGDENETRVTVARDGHVLLIGLDRPDKRNAADWRMLQQLTLAYGELDRDPELRAGLVFGHGDHFSAGLDLEDVAGHIGPKGLDLVPEGGIHPWAMDGRPVSKPVVLAVQGTCLTLGVELALASDIVVAADSTRFGQIEVRRGILPFGGATTRFAARAGWGDAMRWMLTGDPFDAAEALRIGLVQEVVPHGEQYERGLALAQTIAAQAPLAVQATLANARLAARVGAAAAEARLQSELVRLAATEDAAIGLRAFAERSTAEFVGR